LVEDATQAQVTARNRPRSIHRHCRLSKLTTEEESEALPELNHIVRDTEAVREAEATQQLIFLPTGDAMALVFTASIEEPVECASQLSQALRAQPNLQMRMGSLGLLVTAAPKAIGAVLL